MGMADAARIEPESSRARGRRFVTSRISLARIRAFVRAIPRGKVSTYGAVARAAGYPGAARQVVWALRSSEPGLPWHRVLGAGGHIRLPGADGLEQRMRLEAEGVRFAGSRVLLSECEHAFPRTGRGRQNSKRKLN